MKNNEAKEKLIIGSITGAVGLRGEISIYHNADDPEMLLNCESFIIDDVPYYIESIRYKKKTPIVKLEGISDRNAAEELVKMDVCIPSDDLPQLPEGTFYIGELTGLRVISADDGAEIGVIRDVIPGAAQDVYEIETSDGRTMLLPAVSEFITEVDTEEGIVKAVLPGGIEDIVY